MQINTEAYKVFKKIKGNYTNVVVRITEEDMSLVGNHLAYKDHRDFLAAKFKSQGVEVTRWAHEYDSLQGVDPRLGLVYLASDSVVYEALEVHALIGHNARYISE